MLLERSSVRFRDSRARVRAFLISFAGGSVAFAFLLADSAHGGPLG